MKRRAAIVLLLIGMGAAAPITQAHADFNDCARGNALTPQAEMFATNNTSTIADPADPRLQDRLEPFASQVDGTILANTALPVGSELIDGVFWSDDLQQLTFESSRDFHIACVDDVELTRIAEQVAQQFGQESVLMFTYHPDGAAGADSFIADVRGVDVQRFRTALANDPDAKSRLGGGSIGEDGSLTLVASVEDADVAKRVVAASGGVLDMAGVRYGTSEFVP